MSAAPGSGAAKLALADGRTVLPDDPSHAAGPLAGLAAGLTWAAAAGFDALITMTCDTPAVRAEHLARLVEALGEGTAAYPTSADRRHGLCAVWRMSNGPALRSRLAQGDHPAVGALLDEIGARAVDFSDEHAFANVNTLADLAAVAEALSARDRPESL